MPGMCAAPLSRPLTTRLMRTRYQKEGNKCVSHVTVERGVKKGPEPISASELRCRVAVIRAHGNWTDCARILGRARGLEKLLSHGAGEVAEALGRILARSTLEG